jgi:hypothetical protein
MVYPALLPLMRTPRLPVADWTDAPRRFKWTRSFRRKTKSGFCACHNISDAVYLSTNIARCRSQLPRGLMRGFTVARLLGLRVPILPRAWMSVSCECCELSRRGLQRSPTDCGASLCDRKASIMRRSLPNGALLSHKKKEPHGFTGRIW